MSIEKDIFTSMMMKIDKEYYSLMGLGNRMQIPSDYSIDDAKLMKIKT